MVESDTRRPDDVSDTASSRAWGGAVRATAMAAAEQGDASATATPLAPRKVQEAAPTNEATGGAGDSAVEVGACLLP
jgi:hypothetical protein